MGQFRLRDIEEFDNDFRKLIDEKELQSASQNSLIPELNKNEETEVFSGEDETPLIEKEKQKIFENVISDNGDSDDEENDSYSDAEEDKKSVKQPKGLGVLKSLTIVLLVATVLIFVSGCFVSVFLDNNGLSVGGYCFNTQSQDIDSLGIRNGDLIISKKTDINSINANDVVSVPSLTGTGCDVQIVKNIYINGITENINTIAIDDGYAVESSIPNSSSYGTVRRYIPYVGKAITFAMHNAILVCILFVLIAALWCVVLVIIEKKISERKREFYN